MTKMEGYAKKLVLLLGILSLAVVVLISLFFPKLVAIQGHIREINSTSFITLLNGICAIIAIVLLKGLIAALKMRKLKNIKAIIAIELALYFIFMIAITKYYGITGPVDDALAVMDNAITVRDTGVISGWYMVSNPQNLFLMYLYLGITSIFNSFSYPSSSSFC